MQRLSKLKYEKRNAEWEEDEPNNPLINVRVVPTERPERYNWRSRVEYIPEGKVEEVSITYRFDSRPLLGRYPPRWKAFMDNRMLHTLTCKAYCGKFLKNQIKYYNNVRQNYTYKRTLTTTWIPEEREKTICYRDGKWDAIENPNGRVLRAGRWETKEWTTVWHWEVFFEGEKIKCQSWKRYKKKYRKQHKQYIGCRYVEPDTHFYVMSYSPKVKLRKQWMKNLK